MEFNKSAIKYIIVTRFNLYKESYWSGAGIDDRSYLDWCRHRVSLFDNVALPSVNAQTFSDFEWMILFDTEMNEVIEPFIHRVGAIPFVRPVFMNLRGARKNSMRRQLSEAAISTLEPKHTHLSMTRMDSDDALHLQFMRMLRRKVRSIVREDHGLDGKEVVRITFPYCALYDGRQVLVCVLPRNHFPTTLEKVDPDRPPRTTFFTKHSAQYAHDVHVMTTLPATLTLVHGWNVWNSEHESALALQNPGPVLESFGLPASGVHITKEKYADSIKSL